jgi:hypothetical protein
MLSMYQQSKVINKHSMIYSDSPLFYNMYLLSFL